MAELTPLWPKRGYDLDFGAGIALGYATCGEVGFEGRSDYAAIGAVTNLASRLADRRPVDNPHRAASLRGGRERRRRGVGRRVHTQGIPAASQAFNILAVHEPAPELLRCRTAVAAPAHATDLGGRAPDLAAAGRGLERRNVPLRQLQVQGALRHFHTSQGRPVPAGLLPSITRLGSAVSSARPPRALAPRPAGSSQAC